eukprot:m.72990 g.72990  ORF g.72990 m.72990 type:complete len:156 (-) comp8811_c0_seq2:57-524(-)
MRPSTVLLGARRVVMTSKMGNKNYYKGRRCNPTGYLTRKGRFVVDPYRLPQYVVPDLEGFKLKPYVTVATDKATTHPKPPTAEDILKGARAADAIFSLDRPQDASTLTAAPGAGGEGGGTGSADEVDRTSPASFFSGLLFGKRSGGGGGDSKSKS